MCSIKPYDKIIYPEDKTSLVNLIKLKGLYEDLSMLNYPRISSRINKKELSQDIKKTMCHHTLKGVVCCRHLFFGCSRIENCNINYNHMINHVVFNS